MLFRSRLFAGALFAGTLFGPNDNAPVDVVVTAYEGSGGDFDLTVRAPVRQNHDNILFLVALLVREELI